MSSLEDHSTVRRYRQNLPLASMPDVLSMAWLRDLCLQAGADDMGFVALDRSEIDDQRPDILRVFPATRTLISFVCRMNREAVRSVVRSVANNEFHHTYDDVNAVGRRIVESLEKTGVRAVNAVPAFPMEAQEFPTKTWVVAHKPIAVAAGLGQIGLHRNVIHPRFGNFILLGTVLCGAGIDAQSQPIEYNPCLSCKLCVAACPVGAISPTGDFNFSAYYTHNYREFLGGFESWVEELADSRDAADYRRRVTEGETVSIWQSLSFKPGYKAAYCIAACPAGEDVIGPYLRDRHHHVQQVVTPLRDKVETIYVLKGSDAQSYVSKRFPNKQIKTVRSAVHPYSIRSFLFGLKLGFQWRNAKNVQARWHLCFTGQEPAEATITVCNGKLDVRPGLHDLADMTLIADSRTWLRLLRRETHPWRAVLSRRLRIKGNRRYLKLFKHCFVG